MTSLGIVALLGLATYLPPLLLRWASVRRLRRWSRGKLVLTYDDGPYKGHSIHADLLALLERHGVPASFFLVGFRAAESPDACEAIVRAGHEIGWHSYWHRDPWRRPFRAFGDVFAGRSAIRRWQRGALYRPPRGRQTLWSWLACLLQGSQTVFWTLDSGDSRPELPAAESVLRRLRADGGGVVLLHDHHRERQPEQARFTLEVSESMIRLAKERGWRVCPASDFFAGE